jgi:hypothetical protein
MNERLVCIVTLPGLVMTSDDVAPLSRHRRSNLASALLGLTT